MQSLQVGQLEPQVQVKPCGQAPVAASHGATHAGPDVGEA